jgi:hypothetical protein
MIQALLTKKVNAIRPAAILDDASATASTIDCIGWNYCDITCMLGATDIAMTALKVQESDDDSTYADVTGLVYGTSTNDAGSTSTLPTATSDNGLFGFLVDLRGRKRYLKVVATFGNGAAGGYIAALATLSRGEQGAYSAATAGCAQRLIV